MEYNQMVKDRDVDSLGCDGSFVRKNFMGCLWDESIKMMRVEIKARY
jgi:hypothetical protein